jgi:hypothetical protein
MSKEKVLIRPMYKTDPGYRKGMQVAILESTGLIIKKHFDNVGKYISPETYEVVLLPYDKIDWTLAGY